MSRENILLEMRIIESEIKELKAEIFELEN